MSLSVNVYVAAVYLFLLISLFPENVFLVAAVEIMEYYPAERHDLLLLRDSMNSTADLHNSWTGPPCINDKSRWAGITCSNGHVVSLVLEEIQLTGILPPRFLQNITFLNKLSLRNNLISGSLPNLTNLVNLEYVWLSQNRFSDGIPSDYIDLPKLKNLELQENYLDGQIPPFNQSTMTDFNVSYNHLEGPIPQTGVLQSFPSSSFDHNSGLCGSPLENLCPVPPPSPAPATAPPPPPAPPPGKEKNKKGLHILFVALIATGSALIPFLVLLIFLCYYKKVHAKESAQQDQAADGSADLSERKMPNSRSTKDPERRVELEFFDKNTPVFDLDDLLRASAEVLGKGKLGSTYKATLESGLLVAVKRVKNMNGLSKKEFVQQMQLLGKIRHENLVKIVSFYYSREEKLVIYEFLPNGNLFDLLHENRGVGRIPLDWTSRFSIIKEIAKAVAFLHQTLHSHRVPHANLKSSNVLILRDNNVYHAKLTDFGFLPLLPSRKGSERLAIAKSPEFSQGKKLTHKADVYCFGVILLEIITGKIPGEISPGNDETIEDLSDWVRMVVNNDWSTDILDVEILAAREGHNEMLKLTELALECTDNAPEKRPRMTEILRRIEEIEPRIEEND
ncbi:Receptor kinase [Melia azedarach]|uniref:Receptor kinase n=1 Tax=Melia azedarach TaxID=155640 RepID=A0ACC1XSQ2_MELAZ|nr:Receptor kinase [Melia azedarach]